MKPAYYNSMKITPIEYITANELDFCSGNIVKYASRWNKKGTPIEDLRKIIEYANILLPRAYELWDASLELEDEMQEKLQSMKSDEK